MGGGVGELEYQGDVRGIIEACMASEELQGDGIRTSKLGGCWLIRADLESGMLI